MSKQTELVGLARTTNLDEVNAAYSAGALSNRNLIINGAMQVAQRGTSVSSTFSNYLVDRFTTSTTMTTYTYSQSTDAPSGFSNSSKVEVTTAEVAAASDFMSFVYNLEGQDLQRLAKGTASAESVTVSFWVKSNVTGTYILEFDDNDNSRNINKSYTVDVSGDWEYKTITFEGDTSGVFDNDNQLSGLLRWFWDAGTNFTTGTLATSWEATNNVNRATGITGTFGDTIGNYFQITGVQLEVGDTATPFEHRSYGQELALCQRYYERHNATATGVRMAAGNANGANSLTTIFPFLTPKRATPTLSYNNIVARQGGSNTTISSANVIGKSDAGLTADLLTATTIVTGGGYHIRASSSSSYIELDSEL